MKSRVFNSYARLATLLRIPKTANITPNQIIALRKIAVEMITASVKGNRNVSKSQPEMRIPGNRHTTVNGNAKLNKTEKCAGRTFGSTNERVAPMV